MTLEARGAVARGSSPVFRAPRGTHDVLPADEPARAHIIATATRQARLAGYRAIETPEFESADLFIRTNQGTDIVEHQLYLFQDQSGEQLALRPEGTASVCRAYLEHGMANEPQPVKVFYVLPIFRYERPQAGRYRQHTQFGIEAIGVRDPALDVEVMEIGWRTLDALGLKKMRVLLNSIGDIEDRRSYVPVLQEHFRPHLDEMCADCRARFDRAPMRLLDCKEDRCRAFQPGAPLIAQHLRPESREFFESVKRHLDAVGIPYEEQATLVRGLDYYTHTVFEIVPPQAGSQVTVVAGGRYDGLMEQLGGAPTPGIGFGMGIERLAITLEAQAITPPPIPPPPVFVVHTGGAASEAAARIASGLRAAGVGATLGVGGRSLRAQMRQADRAGASVAIIIGAREVESGQVALRDLRNGAQRSLAVAEAVPAVREVLAGN